MQFLVHGYDGQDENAPARRQQHRAAHLERAKAMYQNGQLLFAAAILNGEGAMAGSMLVVEFESEAALRRDWLAAEPYLLGDVWRQVDIAPCKVPGFIKLP